jgi:hypothetical protein
MEHDVRKYLLLEPYEFDQGEHGWRELDNEKKFLEAAEIIEKYIKENKEKVQKYAEENPRLGYVLVFHAGQLYATAGPQYYDKAIEFLNNSFDPDESGWNLYVEGTVAFLQDQKGKLLTCIEKLQNDPELIRAEVLEKLKNGLENGSTYQQAYDS